VNRSARGVALAAVGIALLSALFFTCTYLLNRAAAERGGHWIWTAALRYLITLPIMLSVMPWQGGAKPVWRAIRAHPGPWLLWSGVGFVLFYLLLSFAAASGPSWLVAGTFQLTVIAGMLCAPFLYDDARARIPVPAFAAGLVVIAGVLLMQEGYGRRTPRSQGMVRPARGGGECIRLSARQPQPAVAPGAHRAPNSMRPSAYSA
jgi:hypothetical protein